MTKRKKKQIHVNQGVLRANTNNGRRDPVITCKSYNENQKGNRVAIKDDTGNVVATVVYSPGAPLKCGARCWVETYNEVEVSS